MFHHHIRSVCPYRNYDHRHRTPTPNYPNITFLYLLFLTPYTRLLLAFVLTLSKEQVPLAAEALLACQQELLAPAAITLGTTKRIGNKVIYVSPKTDNSGFQTLGNVLRVIFERFSPFFGDSEENKVCITADEWYQQWLPHATIAKTSADQKNGRRIKFHQEHITSCETEFLDMEINLNRLDLLEMAKVDADGYYKSVATIRFPSSIV